MIDLLLVLGVALCVISVLMAVVAVARTRAPRAAAVTLVLGVVVLFAASWLGDRALGVTDVRGAWQRLISGESFAPESTTTTLPPAAASDAAPEQPAPAAPETAGQPAAPSATSQESGSPAAGQ